MSAIIEQSNLPELFQRLQVGVRSRRELSFTKMIGRGDDEPGHLRNWHVPHGQDDYWSQGIEEGERFCREAMELSLHDETEAFDAIRFAFDSPEWKGGWGQEHGFASSIARLAIVGMRALAAGAEPFVEKPFEIED